MERVHRPAVRIACLDCSSRLLLMHWRDPVSAELLWEPPGGGIEPGETPIQAAVREWTEETGIPVEVVAEEGAPPPALGTARLYADRFRVVHRVERWAGRIVVADEPVFLATCGGAGPQLSRERLLPDEQVNLVGSAWLSRDEVRALPDRVTPDVIDLLRQLGGAGDWSREG